MDWRIASIGTLSSHPMWSERGELRTGHATTTVVKSDDATLLVDPSLPPMILEARLNERWGMDLSSVTHVFLTSFDPDRRRTLEGLGHASWYMHEPEIQSAKVAIDDELHRADDDQEVCDILGQHLDLLMKFDVPNDHLLPQVDLFPVPGYTPGSCGLLLLSASKTVLICGDTIATQEHLDKGVVLSNCACAEDAMESFKECIEIADIFVPGRDNVLANPIRS
jgi:glyoxylase-like metal-dependent hydrolase (beta-lactamase superfamily II)